MMKEEEDTIKEQATDKVEQATKTNTAVPEGSPEDKATENKPNSRRVYLLVGGIALLIIAALCIALPLALRDSDNDNDVNGSSGSTKDPSFNVSGAVVVDKNAMLPLFGEQITNGYSSQTEFESALTVALRSQAENHIAKTLRDYQYYNNRETDVGEPPMAFTDGTDAMEEDVTTTSGAAVADGSGAAAGASSEGVTDFQTNNQEENVDEADIIKADANYIYAAYGDYIVIWDTAGNKVAQVKLPPIDLPAHWGQPWGQDESVQKEPTTTTTSSAKSMIAPDHQWLPKPNINAMLLTDNHLVAIVNGYNANYNWGPPTPVNANGNVDDQKLTQPVLYDHKASQIRLYEKLPNGNLTFVGKKDVNGHYIDARSIGDVVHLATGTGVDVWTHLWGPLDRWNFDEELSEEEYLTQATELAEQTLIPNMARQLTKELETSTTGSMPSMLRINQWMTQYTATDDSTTANATNPNVIPFDQYNVVNNLGQVTSFNVNSDLVSSLGDLELDVSASAYMAPSYFDTLYGTEDHLVLATSGWDWDAATQESNPTTYLVALEINSETASTSFLSVGTLRGHLLNSYALDIVGDELRAATTVENNMWWWGGGGPIMPFAEPMMMEDAAVRAETAQAQSAAQGSVSPRQAPAFDPDAVVDQCVEPTTEDDCISEESYDQCEALVNAGCEVIVQTVNCPPTFTCADDVDGLCPVPTSGDDCVTAENYRVCLSLVKEGCASLSIMESCPLQFDCESFEVVEDVLPPPPEPTQNPEDEESRTENYMTVLKLTGGATPGLMEKKGDVQIGLKHERITAVRFFDNVAYAVTFERTDPFYVLDMTIPAVLGELKLPGFSSYLHPMNDDNTLLLAVGQNATDNGMVTGLMVTVFDATDPANPQALVSHTFEQSDSAHSSSSVEWDYKAFRYVDGKLVLPLDIYYYQEWNQVTQQLEPLPEGAENFQGFAVLDVSTTAISEAYRVSHTQEQGSCRFCGGYLPTRSFVYSGDLMTVRDNVVVSTGLHSGEEAWRLPISVEGEPADCCW